MYVAYFFVNQDRVGYPRCVLDWVDESGAMKLSDLSFNSWGFSEVKGVLFLVNGGCIRPCVNVVFHYGEVLPDIFVYVHVKMSQNSCKRALYLQISSVEHDAPRSMCSMQSGTTKMSTLIVGEILSMFPSSKALGVEIEFVNQYTWPRGMKSLPSSAYCLEYSEKVYASYGEIMEGCGVSAQRSLGFNNAPIIGASEQASGRVRVGECSRSCSSVLAK